jgi:small-conductance mechanosensitive channel
MKINESGVKNFFDIAYETLVSPSFYMQSLAIIGCFILSFIVYEIALHILSSKTKLSKQSNLVKISNCYLPSILAPLLITIFLSIGCAIYLQFFKEAILFSTTIELTTLFLLLRFLRVFSGSNFIANIVGTILIPSLILDVFGLLNATIKYLDYYAINIGSFRISIYIALKAFMILMIVFWLANLVSKKSKYYIEITRQIKSSNKAIIVKFTDIIIYFIVLIVTLKLFGFDMTTLTVISGAIGVGVGFGLQKIASNFISGIILLFEKSVKIGDLVELENGNISGYIKYFGARYGLIETFDGKEIIIPNEYFIINQVTNLTYNNNRIRIEVNFGVAYNADLKLVRQLAIAAATENERCLQYPEIECHLVQFADFDIKFTLYFWVNDVTKGRMNAKSEVLMNIWTKFKENNIEIPLPQREIKIL